MEAKRRKSPGKRTPTRRTGARITGLRKSEILISLKGSSNGRKIVKKKQQAQRLEEAQSNIPAKETGGNLGTDPRETASRAHPFGSSTLVGKGPEAAGRPVPSDQPPAGGGDDRGERVDRPGQLVQCGGRKGGLPEPVSAPLTTRSSKDRLSNFSSCSAQPIRLEGKQTPPMFLAFQGAAVPRKPDARAPND